jgi:SAM-dependent methyltransferase
MNLTKWQQLQQCPACGEQNTLIPLGTMDDHYYSFGQQQIPLPNEGVTLMRCPSCQLVFKQSIPTPKYLSDVFVREAGNVWDVEYNYRNELELIKQYAPNNFDILDVGPSNGDLLQAIRPYCQRCSGLDVVAHPKVMNFVHGEFITALLDEQQLQWSETPYDVVTVFDVFEHLYDPTQAIKNLHSLLKPGGLAFIETGNVDSSWAQRYGIPVWWYVSLFEHHVFWSPASLTALAEKHGFELVAIKEKRHKRWPYEDVSFVFSSALRAGLWRFSPCLFKSVRQKQGKNPKQPRSPFVRDHMMMILRKR